MIRKTNLWSIFFITLLFLASCATVPTEKISTGTGTLTVVISGFPSSDGYAMVKMNDSKKQYEEGSGEPFAKTKIKIENAVARAVFKDVPYGEYGISLYHDENSNRKLDKNAMGIPKESYAFSNDARGMFGKPDWDEAKFQMDAPEKEITISMD